VGRTPEPASKESPLLSAKFVPLTENHTWSEGYKKLFPGRSGEGGFSEKRARGAGRK